MVIWSEVKRFFGGQSNANPHYLGVRRAVEHRADEPRARLVVVAEHAQRLGVALERRRVRWAVFDAAAAAADELVADHRLIWPVPNARGKRGALIARYRLAWHLLTEARFQLVGGAVLRV